MSEFNVEEYLQKLHSSTSCETCKKVPSPKLGKKERYIFISYSHKDYKQVYADLAELYAADIPFWYDEGLPAGQSWDEVVRQRMTDPLCAGVIFYLSENLFLSRSIQTEIGIACGQNDDSVPQKRNYFCVNLSNSTPFEISRKTILQMPFSESTDQMVSQLEWLTTLTHAFSDRITYLSFDKFDHTDELFKQIALVFGIDPDLNAFSFDGAVFHSGNGIIEFENGAVYNGAFADGKFHGGGTLKYPNGNVYQGEWYYGKRHGTGIHTRSDGSVYDGHWEDGKPHGQGTMTYADGAHYQGGWAAGHRHGFGTMMYPDGGTYEGEWEKGKANGYGVRKYKSGAIYKGEWLQGKRHGMGKYTYAKGVYEGQFTNGKKSGQGKMIYRNGNVYTGEWHNDLRSGHGTMTYSEGSVYIGEWSEDKRNGIGTETISDGETYTGEWVNNRRHGHGTLTYPDGETISGLFENDFLSLE